MTKIVNGPLLDEHKQRVIDVLNTKASSGDPVPGIRHVIHTPSETRFAATACVALHDSISTTDSSLQLARGLEKFLRSIQDADYRRYA